MRIKWGVVLAFLVLVGVAVWAYDSVRMRSYSGNEITFEVGNGPVTIINTGEEPAPLQMTNPTTRGVFAVRTSDLEDPITSVREGSGRTAVQIVTLEIPPGTTELQLTRGSGANASLTGPSTFDVSVFPQSPDNARGTITFALIAAAACIIYMFFQTRSAWMRLFQRGTANGSVTDSPAAPDLRA